MASFDLVAAGDALKTIFQDPITNQIVDKSDLLDWFEQNTNVRESDFGKEIQVSNIYGDTEGVGARQEKGYIPEALDPAFLKQTLRLRYVYGTVQMTYQVMRQMRAGMAAFIDWADAQLKRMEKAVRQEIDRELFGFGAGLLAQVDTVVNATTLKLKSAYGAPGVLNPAKLIRIGSRHRFFANPDATTEHNQAGAVKSSKVQSVDRKTQNVVYSANVANDIVANDFVIRGDDAGHNGQISGEDSEFMGLFGHIDDGDLLTDYFGQDRANYQFLRAQVFDGGAGPYNGNLTETLLMLADDDAQQYGNGEPDAALCSRGVLRNFWAQLRTSRVFNDPRNYVGGKRDLEISLGDKTITLRGCRQCPEGTLFLLDRSTLQRIHNTGWEWDDTTGAVFKQVVDSTGRKDEFYAFGRWFMQTFCTAPQQNARIDNLAESVA